MTKYFKIMVTKLKSLLMLIKRLLFLLFTLSLGYSLFAQKTITGTVYDNSSLGIPGVTIVEKGTTNGAISMDDGSYTIEVAGDDARLVFTFIGMKTEEVAVGQRRVIDMTLVSEFADLDEVIVVGYGVQKKKLNTGATIQVRGEDLERMNTVSPLSAMQGKTPGVNIVQKSGKPGDGFKVTVRGLGTIGDSSPLYIVDGVQTDMSNVNPSDIESIDVLKDAASAAIYGARGANGVVIVTTKSGKSGTSSINYDGYYGVQNIYKKLEFMDAQEFMAYQDMIGVNEGTGRINWAARGVDKSAIGAGTSWIDEALNKNAPTQSHTISMSGGNDLSTYSSSIGYSNQEGIIGVGDGKSTYERLSFRINSEHVIVKDILKFGQHLNLLRINTGGIQTGGLYNNSIRGLYVTHPLLANKDEDGNYVNYHQFNDEVGNPVASMDIKNNNAYASNKVIGDFYFDITPFKNFTFKSLFAFDYYGNNGRSYTPNYGKMSASDEVDFNKVSMSMSHGTTWTFDNTATYLFDVGQHSFTTMIGASVQSYSGEEMYSEKQDMIFDSFDLAYLNSAKTVLDPSKVQGKANDDAKSASFFGRVSYDYKEKYMGTLTVRRDGSSKFGANSRWGTFPSVSLGWLASSEDFLSDLDYLRFRASWGQNGNDKIDAFRYLATISSILYYPFGSDDSNHAIASAPGRGANADLKWETSEQINIGIDSRWIRSRMNVVIDLYNKTTKDWLVQAPVLDIKGTTPPYINGGDVTNKGIELAIDWNDNVGKLNYSIGVNGAINKNKVNNIPNDDGIIRGDNHVLWQGIPDIYRAETGFPIGYFWGHEVLGIFQTQEEVDNYKNSEGKVIQPRAEPGDVKYKDVNDDGQINDRDKVQIGNPHPSLTYGVNISLEYKGIDLSINGTGVYGNDIAKGMIDFSRPSSTNYPREFYTDTWSVANRDGNLPRALKSAESNWKRFSTLYLEDGSYFRIQNVTLGYDLNRAVRTPFKQIRVYVQAQNLATFTKYSGMDPEIGYAPQDWAAGIDIGYFPHPRTYLVGANIKF